MNNFEQLIEFIINEQEDKARELFHRIVVDKSRDIYESMMEEEDDDNQYEDVGGNQVTGLVDDIEADETGLHDDEDRDEFEDGGDEEDEGEYDERIADLETALEDLKREFDELMDAEESEHHEDESEDDEFSDEGEDEMVREYVERVASPIRGEGSMVGKEGSTSINKRSTVASKNDMGGTSKNVARGGAEVAPEGKRIPDPSNQYSKNRGSLKGAGNFENVPGAKTKGYSRKESALSKQGQTLGGSVNVQDKSVVGGRVR